MGWKNRNQEIALAIIPKFSSILSLCGSTWIIIEVLTDNKGPKPKRQHPYHRLLCAMSVYDVLESIWNFFSTWPIPRGTEGVAWPVGTTATCSAQGFFLTLSVAVPIYNTMLSLYYLLVICYKTPDETLKKWVEPMMHLVAGGWAFFTALYSVSTGLINNANLWCWIAPLPGDCLDSRRFGEEGNCIRGDNAWIYQWAFYFGPLWFCIFLASFFTYLVYRYVNELERSTVQYRRPERFSFLNNQLKANDRSSNEAVETATTNAKAKAERLQQLRDYEQRQLQEQAAMSQRHVTFAHIPSTDACKSMRCAPTGGDHGDSLDGSIISCDDQDACFYETLNDAYRQDNQEGAQSENIKFEGELTCDSLSDSGLDDDGDGDDSVDSTKNKTINNNKRLGGINQSGDNNLGCEVTLRTFDSHGCVNQNSNPQSGDSIERQDGTTGGDGTASTSLNAAATATDGCDPPPNSQKLQDSVHSKGGGMKRVKSIRKVVNRWQSCRQEFSNDHQRTLEVYYQALWYVGTFYITHFWSTSNRIVLFVRRGQAFFPIILMHSLFDPLQGFLNYFVYQRPRYLRIRKKYPSIGRMGALRRMLRFSYMPEPKHWARDAVATSGRTNGSNQVPSNERPRGHRRANSSGTLERLGLGSLIKLNSSLRLSLDGSIHTSNGGAEEGPTSAGKDQLER